MNLVALKTKEYGDFYVNPHYVHACFRFMENGLANGTIVLLPGGAQHVDEPVDEVTAKLSGATVLTPPTSPLSI